MAETTSINLGCINGRNGDKGKYRTGSNGCQGISEIYSSGRIGKYCIGAHRAISVITVSY